MSCAVIKPCHSSVMTISDEGGSERQNMSAKGNLVGKKKKIKT